MRLLAIIFAASLSVSAADPRLGTWALVSARSNQEPPRTFKATIENGALHFSSTGIEFTARYDGQPYVLTGFPAFDHVALHRSAQNEIQFYMKDGKVIETDRAEYSGDGNEMVETNSFVLPSRPDVAWVWERTGGARDPDSLFIGEWARNLSRSQMRQGIVLKIESDGGEGVRFSGDCDYLATPDGADYPVKNCRYLAAANTISIRIVDARIVASTYKSGGKTLAQDRWVVSGEGKRMTETVDAMLRNGVKLHEELEFAKR